MHAISGTHKSALVFRSFVDQCLLVAQAARTARVLAGWPAQGMGRESGGEDDAAELYGHVVVGRLGLPGVPAVPDPGVITSSGACPCRADQRVTTLNRSTPTAPSRSTRGRTARNHARSPGPAGVSPRPCPGVCAHAVDNGHRFRLLGAVKGTRRGSSGARVISGRHAERPRTNRLRLSVRFKDQA
jgi:hypothetical protein